MRDEVQYSMISTNKRMKAYCSEPLSHIENYQEAMNDPTRTWVIHHRKEIDNGVFRTPGELIENGMYWHRPASELIFLTKSEHSRIHLQNPEIRAKMSSSMKGRKLPPVPDERKARIRNSLSDKCKPVVMSRDGVETTFQSIRMATAWCRENGYPKAAPIAIKVVCRGVKKSAYGAKWRFKE